MDGYGRYEFPDEWAESYFGNRLHTTKWDEAETEDREKALSMATSMLFAVCDFVPSAFTLSEDGTTIEEVDERVKAAICEQAIYLLEYDPTAWPSILTLGMSQASAGPSGTFDKSFVAPYICVGAKAVLGTLASISGVGESLVVSSELEW